MDEKYNDSGILDIGNAVSIRLMFHPLNWIRLIVDIAVEYLNLIMAFELVEKISRIVLSFNYIQSVIGNF